MKKPDIRDQFPRGMRVTLVNVAIDRHRERYCGRTGVVVKAVKSKKHRMDRIPRRRPLRRLPGKRPSRLTMAPWQEPKRANGTGIAGARRGSHCSQIDNGEECI